MKLRNKKTGEIATVEGFGSAEGEIQMTYTIDNDETKLYLYCTPSLTTFNEEWEDYEEPSKTIWQIKDSGELQDFEEDVFSDGYIESSKSIGNYFDTREEAEKAVEKLKAWKRLKEAGFEFGGWTHTPITKSLTGYNLHIKAYSDKLADYMDDLDLLFGGEK
jgi:hypothetical protein